MKKAANKNGKVRKVSKTASDNISIMKFILSSYLYPKEYDYAAGLLTYSVTYEVDNTQ